MTYRNRVGRTTIAQIARYDDDGSPRIAGVHLLRHERGKRTVITRYAVTDGVGRNNIIIITTTTLVLMSVIRRRRRRRRWFTRTNATRSLLFCFFLFQVPRVGPVRYYFLSLLFRRLIPVRTERALRPCGVSTRKKRNARVVRTAKQRKGFS